MKTTQYLDAAKRLLGIASDYALAKHLHLTQQAVSKLRRGAVMSNTTAAHVANILELPLQRVIADLELERGSSPDLWKRLRDAAVVAALAIGAACFGLAPQPAQAAGRFNNNEIAVNFPGGEGAPSIGQKYTLRRIRRSVGAAIAALIAWLVSATL